MGLLDFITPVDGGPIRVRERGFAFSVVQELGRCAVENRGAWHFVEGASGTADEVAVCRKNDLDDYEWQYVTLVDP